MDLDIRIKKDEKRSLKRRQQQRLQNSNGNHYGFPTNSILKLYLWIENKLLQTAIPDHRKYTVELVLAPYLINIKHLPVGYTYSLIKEKPLPSVWFKSSGIGEGKIDYFHLSIEDYGAPSLEELDHVVTHISRQIDNGKL